MASRLPFWRPVAGWIAAALLIAGCSTSAPPAAPSANDTSPQQGTTAQPAAKAIKRGGTLTRSTSNSYAGADPAMGANSFQLWNQVGTFMIRREPDTWKLVPDAIEKWEYAPNGMELTLQVRKGFHWEDKPPVNGREIEAKDVVYSLRSMVGLQYPDLPPIRFPRLANLADMEDALVVDKYTVKVKMKAPSSVFLDGLADFRSPIIPDQIREAFGGRDSLVNPSVERYFSAGPFVLTKFVDSIEAVYSRYPNYWEKAEDGQTKPYLDAVREIWIPDRGTQNAAFLSGQIDLLALSSPEDRNTIVNTKKDTQVVTYSPESCWHRLGYNMTRKPFDDVRVRRALSLVLDPVETGKALYGEWDGKPLWRYPGPLPWSFPEAIPEADLKKLPFYESPKSQKTIEEARQLLKEAGIEQLTFDVVTYAGTAADAAQLISSQISRALPNVTAKLTILDIAILVERANKGEFDTQYYCYLHEPTAVGMMKSAFYSKSARNVARLNDADMDRLLDEAGRELDDNKRLKLLREAQNRALEVLSFMPTLHYAQQMALQPYVRGMRLGGGTRGHSMFAKEVWLEK